MEKEITIYPSENIEKKNEDLAKNLGFDAENSDNFRKLLGQVIIEIILKRKKNGRRWVYKNK